jgi:hypothetical protein
VWYITPPDIENMGLIGEHSLGFRRGEETRDASGLLGIMSERSLDVDEELCMCFMDGQKAFDIVNWTKLMQILEETGIDWRERRLVSRL